MVGHWLGGGGGGGGGTSLCDLGITFDLGSAKKFLLPYLRHISSIEVTV